MPTWVQGQWVKVPGSLIQNRDGENAAGHKPAPGSGSRLLPPIIYTVFSSNQFTLTFRKISLDIIGLVYRNSFNGIIGTISRDRTLIAVQTKVMPDLEMQGTISEGGASFHAFSASDTQIFIDGKFKERFFNESPLDRRGWTELIFRCRIQIRYTGFEKAAAKIAVSTQIIGMDTFDSGWGHHTFIRATSALGAFERIDLPYPFPGHGLGNNQAGQSTQPDQQGNACRFLDEIPPFIGLVPWFLFHDSISFFSPFYHNPQKDHNGCIQADNCNPLRR
jgi:hypothetical protein